MVTRDGSMATQLDMIQNPLEEGDIHSIEAARLTREPTSPHVKRGQSGQPRQQRKTRFGVAASMREMSPNEILERREKL